MTHTLKEKWGQLPDPQIISKGCCHCQTQRPELGAGVVSRRSGLQRASHKAPPGDVCRATGRLLRLTPPASTWNPRHMGVGQDVREPSQPPGNNDLEGKWKMTVIPERCWARTG